MDLSDVDLDSTRELPLGEELYLRLPENPTTGYLWQVSQSGDGELRVLDSRFEPAGSAPVGSGGTRVFHYVASKPGTVLVRAVKARPWEAAGTTGQQLIVVIR